MILARQFDRVFIILDGLDEVDAERREETLDFVWKAKSELQCAKLFIASRGEPDIAKTFQPSTGAIQIPVRAANVENDITQYINLQLDQLLKPAKGNTRPKGQLRIQNPAMRDMIFQELVSHANGMFLWVDLQLQNLRHQKNDEDIERELRSLPRGLQETYDRIWGKICHQSDSLRTLAIKCLQWVLTVKRLITLNELERRCRIE